MTQPTISAERIEEMMAGLEGPVGAAVIRGDDLADVRTAMTLALSALRVQAHGSEAVAWPNPKAALSEHEAISAGRALAQWRASLKRYDLSDEDRVKGAIEAYQRQAFALADLATPPAPVDGGVTDALSKLVDAVSNMRVPQNIAEAGIQVMLTLGPALENARAALTAAQAAVAQDETP